LIGVRPDRVRAAQPHALVRQGLCLVLVFFTAFAQSTAHGSEGFGDFIRVSVDESGRALALQVNISRYFDADGRVLDLVGAVHLADRAFYQELNRRFERYDRVLYELVGEPSVGTSTRDLELTLAGRLQGVLKDLLGLTFQLDQIDYRRPQFVHADLTGQEFADSLTSRNESWFSVWMDLWAASMAGPAGAHQAIPEIVLLRLLLANDRQLALKRLLAETLSDRQGVLETLGGEQGSTLISVRNGKALTVLERELALGARTVALFYGAGHMPDFHRRLTADHGFVRQSVEWLDAWRLVK